MITKSLRHLLCHTRVFYRRFAVASIQPHMAQARKQASVTIDVHAATQTQVIKVPIGSTNSYRLSRLFGVEAHLILKKLQELCREPYTDEFQLLSSDAIETMALEFDKEVELVEERNAKQVFKVRAPVVTIMGHVDHGKTTLLDAFRRSSRVKEEFGDITQSIGAFTFRTDNDYEVTFIDTPGHEAFNNLRVRGAKVTDMIILVISAIESVQP